jgi:hypothetical protein
VATAASGAELRDPAQLARDSVVIARTVTLARWIGTGSRPVTQGATIALVDQGSDAALSSVWEQMPGADLEDRLAVVRATGHPEAEALASAVDRRPFDLAWVNRDLAALSRVGE